MSQSPIDDFSHASTLRYRQGWKALNRLLHLGRSFSGREANCAFLNTTSGKFADISAVSGLNYLDDGRAIATSDWDFDGDLDLWTTNRTAPRVRFLRNNLKSKNAYVAISLRGNGTTTNSDAIGARVELTLDGAGPSNLVKTLHAGDAFLSQSTSWLHFGLGERNVEKLVVRWPGGAAETFSGLANNNFYVLKQGSGKASPWSPPTSPQTFVSSEPKLPIPAPIARIVLPARLQFPGTAYLDASGKEVSIDQNQGRPVLVNLWGSWCAPCLVELSDWTKHQKEFQEMGLDVLALSLDKLEESGANPAAASALMQKLKFPYQHGWATDKFVQAFDLFQRAALDEWRALPVPSSVLLDADGQVSVIYLGPVETEQVLSDLELVSLPEHELRDRAIPFAGRWITDPPDSDPLRVCIQFIDHADINGAVDYLRRYAAKQTKAEPTKLGDVYYMLGTLLGEQKQNDEAIDALRSAAQFNPNDLRYRRDLATALLRKNELNEAAEHLTAAIRIQPKNVELHAMLATIHYQQEQFADSVDSFEAALKIQPSNLAIRTNLANALRKNGDLAAAISQYREILRIQPSNPMAANNLAWILSTHTDSSIRNGSEAVEIASRLVGGAGMKEPNAWGTMGAAFAEVGKFDDAIEAVEKAMSLATERKMETMIPKLQGHIETLKSSRPIREAG